MQDFPFTVIRLNKCVTLKERLYEYEYIVIRLLIKQNKEQITQKEQPAK